MQKLCDRVAIIKEGKIVRIDTMSSLKENSYLKVSIDTEVQLPESFKDENMMNYRVLDGNTSFLYNGNINDLMQKLAKLSLIRINLTEPDLEEIFMHYYVKE